MKPNPLALLALFALLIFVAVQTEGKFKAQMGRFTVQQEGSAVVFRWRDGVEYPMSERLKDTFRDWRSQVDHIIIDLSSPGGAVSEGRAVIEIIDEMKKTHLVETRVLSNRSCLSMCVPIYLQGEKRTASPSSRWMFHEPSSVDAVTGERRDRPGFEQRYETRKFVDQYFRDSEMNPAWIKKLESEWQGKDIWKSGRQLVDENSGIILELQ